MSKGRRLCLLLLLGVSLAGGCSKKAKQTSVARQSLTSSTAEARVAPMPPPPPNFPELAVSGLTITNAGGGITLKLMTTDSLPEGTMLWGAAPCSQGRNTARRLVFLGTLSPPVGNAIDISSAYEARFGAPRVGSKVFVQVNQNLSGWEDLRGRFWATVPAAA